MSNLERYKFFAQKWLDMNEINRNGSSGKGLRATINTAWFLLQDKQEQIAAEQRPEVLFKGYKL